MNHVLFGEINAQGKATGYHAEFAAEGSARISPDATIKQNPNGTYEASVQIFDPKKVSEPGGGWVDKKNISTFFPPSWSPARIEYEVSEAFKVGQAKGITGERFIETSPSGIKMQFSWDVKNQRITFYPIGK